MYLAEICAFYKVSDATARRRMKAFPPRIREEWHDANNLAHGGYGIKITRERRRLHWWPKSEVRKAFKK